MARAFRVDGVRHLSSLGQIFSLVPRPNRSINSRALFVRCAAVGSCTKYREEVFQNGHAAKDAWLLGQISHPKP